MLLNEVGTPIAVINGALALIGEKQLTSIEESSERARSAKAIYEITVQDCLIASRWRFNMRQEALVRLAEPPLERFTARYQSPANALTVHSISVGGREIDFDQFEGTVHCSAGEGDVVVADFAVRKSEEHWPPGFTRYVMETLASDLCAGLLSRPEEGAYWRQSAEVKRRMAASREAQNRTVNRLDTQKFNRIRRR